MQIGVLGAGSWGSALAIAFSQFSSVQLWSRNQCQVEQINQLKTNIGYLPDNVLLNANVVASNNLHSVLSSCDLIVIATPISGFRAICMQLYDANVKASLLWACKGLELETSLLPHQIILDIFGNLTNCGALLGPSFAREVACGLPTAITLASTDINFALKWSDILSKANNFRVYAHDDIIGAEIGASVKNIMAIAVGISDGLGLGLNARAALMTRSLNELSLLVLALGGSQQTIYGLSGVGDLILTCTGDLSRNRTVGIELASGKSLNTILTNLGHVAEGVYATKEIYTIAKRMNLEMPIVDSVYRILYNNGNLHDEVNHLINRKLKSEFGIT